MSAPILTLPAQLPGLREDLKLLDGPRLGDGSPSWVIQDPVANAFYRIGWLEFEMLSRWHLGSMESVLAAMRSETPLDASAEEFAALRQFLQHNHLLAIHSPRHTETLLGLYRRSRLSRARWLLQHYLFFRIPLWHPERWLQRTLPRIAWIYRNATLWALLGLCVLGLALTFRQIDAFSAAFVDTLTPSGFAAYFVALVVTKSLHELGHAFTATRYGLRVAHMGLAFLVMWPLLYTDTGESWRLRNSRQRLAIASAGIVTELAIAGLATLAWNFVPAGPLRQACLFLGTTAWVLSLAINASPFMRFDGYFILSDLVDMPNLHERAGALARAWLRRVLLGWSEAAGESFPPRQRRALIAFALLTWVYRLTVFFGIALLVYHYFFKLLGIFLFCVEVGWFILRPVLRELRLWHQRRDEIPRARRALLGAGVALAALLLLLPWSWSVSAPAWIHAAESQVIYSPGPARLVALDARAGAVAAGARLFTLASPEAALHMRVAETRAGALDQRLAGLAALPEGEDQRASIEEERAMRLAERSAGSDEQQRLALTAPFAGVLSDIDPELRPGQWVSPKQPLAVLWQPDAWVVEAFVTQGERLRLQPGAAVRFYPSAAPLSALRGTVDGIDDARTVALPNKILAAPFGGEIGTLREHDGLMPSEATYRVRIVLHERPAQAAVARGRVVIDASPSSWGLEALRAVFAVFVREAGF